MLSSKLAPYYLLLIILAAFSCKKDDDGGTTPTTPAYNVPASYNFENVSYSGQTDRLNQLEEMTFYMKTANSSGTVLDAQKLKDMYANTNDDGNGHFTFSTSKQLKSKTFELDQSLFEGYMDAIAAASNSSQPGSNGQAGVVESNDGSKQYLFDENGIEYTQLIEKGLMGAVFYYQATAVYMSEDRIGNQVDNTIVEPGKGTDMEHHWDEAFGYFGVPIDFPDHTDDIRFHGKYCNSRDGALGTNALVMNAFLKGRAAISNKDNIARDEARDAVRTNWELVIAATGIHYLNGGVTDFADDALRNHQLSEAIAFISSLKYNPVKTISNTQIDSILNKIGDNLYEVTVADLQSARDELAVIYNLEDVKATL